MTTLLSDDQLIDRILQHIDNKTTDMGSDVWREPSEHYSSQERFNAELALIKRSTVPFCPAAMLTDKGSYVARKSAGVPILVVRGMDGEVRGFINGCRHRGMPVADGSGCARAFVCPYHAWSYSLDGSLRNIAGSHGFPGVDAEQHGLIQVSVREHGGLILVNQETEIADEDLAEIPDFFSQDQEYFEQDSVVDKTKLEADSRNHHGGLSH